MEIKRLLEEIKASEDSLVKLKQIIKDSEAAIEINTLVLEAFRAKTQELDK